MPLGGCGGEAPPVSPDACRSAAFEGSRFTVCSAIPGTHRIALVNRGADGGAIRSFTALEQALGADAQTVAFATNAGMFDRAGRPVGLYVEEGEETKPLNRRAGPGNFHLKPNGVFWGDAAGWHVADTDRFAARRHPGLRFATQSGPMLVIGGRLHPRIAADGPSELLRNGVCVDSAGVARFAISEAPVSFGRFARLFRDALGCRDALFLDGSVSGLWNPAGGRQDPGPPLGPIVVVRRND